MNLFLDPDSKRAALAFNRMSKEDQSSTIWCQTVLEAQTTLWNYRKELVNVWLEHDLGETPYQNTGSEQSGMELVRYLENLHRWYPIEFSDFKKVKFVIHTWNEHAGPLMVNRLKDIGLDVELKPFGM